MMQDYDSSEKREVFTKIVKAGRRTYFIDVKKTRKNQELFLTITESKKRTDSDGRYKFEKHKLYLYQEDFNNFMDAMSDAMDFIADSDSQEITNDADLSTDIDNSDLDLDTENKIEKELNEVEFEDLGK